MTPKVSVIVPVYKVERYVERCVRSLMEQTLEDMEFIFVDDCTPDGSVAIIERTVEEYPARKGQARIIHHPRNMGLAQARATGIKEATGDFIAHCDSDDWVATEMYAEMYAKAINEKMELVSCDMLKVFSDGKTLLLETIDWPDDMSEAMKKYIASSWTVTVTLLVKRDVYERMIEDSEDALQRTPALGISYCEDFHLTTRLLYFVEKAVRINKPFYFYNQLNESSILHNENVGTMNDEIKAYTDIISFFMEKGIYQKYTQELCWRVLKSKQEMILDKTQHEAFLGLHPESHKYIWSCPYIGIKLKLMMWGKTHHCDLLTLSILALRTLKSKIKKI